MDPRIRIGLLVAVGALAVLLDRPASLVALTVVAAVPLMSMRIGWTWRARALGAAAAVGSAVWAVAALSMGGTDSRETW